MRAWLLQRLTAVYLLLYFLAALVYFGFFAPADYRQWREFVAATPVAVATLLFFLALFAHTWIGLRDVVVDYIRPLALRLAVLSLIAGALFLQAAWLLLTLLRAMS